MPVVITMLNVNKELSYLKEDLDLNDLKLLEKAIQDQIELFYCAEVKVDLAWYKIINKEIFLPLLSLYLKKKMMNSSVEVFIANVQELVTTLNLELQQRIWKDTH